MERTKPATWQTAIALCSGLIGVILLSTAAWSDEPPPVASFHVPASGPAGSDESSRPADDLSRGPSDSATMGNDGPLMSFNFRFAPWTDVLKLFAETVGLTLDLTDTPPGTFNYFDTRKYTPTGAIDVLNGYLLPRGFLLIRRDRFLVCLNVERGVPPNLVPKVRPEDLPDRGENELLTVVFDLDGGQVEQAAAEVQQLLGPHGKVVSLQASGSLLVTDAGRSLRLIHDLLQRSDFSRGPTSPGSTVFRAFPLKHISAREGERLVRGMFGQPGGSGGPAGDGRSVAGRMGAGPGAIRLTAESRTNTLFVTAPSDNMDIVAELLEAADVDSVLGETPAGPGGFRTTVEVLPLGSADVARIGRALGSLTPRIRVSTTGGPTVPAEPTPRGPPPPVGSAPEAVGRASGADSPTNGESVRGDAGDGR